MAGPIGADAATLIIRSEEDAWNWLSAAINSDSRLNNISEIKFEGWPKLQIHLNVGDSSISGSLMEGLLELQESIRRSYSLIKYDTVKLTNLTDEEKYSLEINVKVSGGSSNFLAVIEKNINAIGHAAATKMTGNQLAIVILGCALSFGGYSAWDSYLQYRLEMRREETASEEKKHWLDTLKFMTEKETERMKIMERALGTASSLRDLDDLADSAKRGILRSIPDDADAEIGRRSVPGEVAKELAKNPRNEARTSIISGTFSVVRIDWSSPTGIRVRVRNTATGEELTAYFKERLFSAKQVNNVQEAEWQRRPFFAEIETIRRGGQIIEANIKTVKEIDDEREA